MPQDMTKENSKVIASESAQAQVKNAKARENATYNERMHVNKALLCQNLSKLWKDCTTGTLIPRDVLTLTKEQFAEFRTYMCERHGLQAGESPRKGWSVWYALQFCEKQVAKAAKDESAPTHAKAVAYLRKSRAALQESANKLF